MDDRTHKPKRPTTGQGQDHLVLSPQSLVLHVAPGDTLERVLDRVRASEAADVVLDVDAASPLLISLQHLHQLDELAQERGLHVAIASANSKLLNAARVFGIAVIDARDAAVGRGAVGRGPWAVGRGDEAPATDQPRAISDDDGDEDGGAGDEAEPASPRAAAPDLAPAPDHAGTGESRRARKRRKRRHGASRPTAPAWEGDADAPGDDAPNGEVADESGEDDAAGDARPAPAALDPYGQPYGPGADGDDELTPPWYAAHPEAAPARPARTIRPLGTPRRPQATQATPAWEDDAEAAEGDGWDGEPTAGDEDLLGDDEELEPEPPSGPGRLLAGARAWLAARRARAAAADDWDESDEPDEPEAPEAEDDAGESDGDDGWGTLPGRPAVARAAVGMRARPAWSRSATVAEPAGRDDYDDATDEDTYEAADEDAGAGVWRAPARRQRQGTLIGYTVVAALLVGVAAVAGLYLMLASATVTLTPRTGTLTTAFDVVVGEIDPNSPQGQPTKERIVSPATRLNVPVTASAAVPATGFRLEPDGTAAGQVVLTNASTKPVAVPQGTNLAGTDGHTYVTQEGVTVPAADPFNTGAFGAATVKVAAAVRGSGGNADAGVVRGQLPSGVFYNNRAAPIAGGTDRKIPVVAQADLAAAQAAAEDAARAKGQAALAAAVPTGGTTMPDTAGTGNFAVQYSAAAGADAQTVTATVTATATALVYRQADVEARARAEVARRLADGAPPGETIVPGTARIDGPTQSHAQPGLITYHVGGTARTRAAVGDDAARARLASSLAGKGDDEARAILAATPGIASYTITYAPAWFPHRMPWRASRIVITLATPSGG
ncbi:MAG TPA: hypothetical protein VFW96_18300 [Thermomicrobiales bacterium]|nr:hypothetical protein [Thermomicrobiales bacterium]